MITGSRPPEANGAARIRRQTSSISTRRLNADLAVQVADLNEANLELAAFNRMVSHDLRQPLNAMALLIQALEMTCSDELGDECRGYVQSIYKKNQGNDDLIDTLLRFSSSTGTELNREPVNLTGFAWSVATEVEKVDPIAGFYSTSRRGDGQWG